MAVGLGSMDMPVPSVAEWAWLNWKFPRAVHAGETIYARWTLTQKRAPVGGSPTAIAVWRVDVHTIDGALCAEGEIGASVMRATRSVQARPAEPTPKAPIDEPVTTAASSTAAPRRGRRRRRTPAGDGTKAAAAIKPAKAIEPAAKPPAAAPAGPERSASGPRRRRRRRSPGSAATRNGDAPVAAAALAIDARSSPPVATTAAAPGTANPLTRAIRRLRRSGE
jgi:hypothetical protein